MKKNTKFSILSSKKTVVILTFLGLYLLVSGASWIAFSVLSNSTANKSNQGATNVNKERSKINLDAPKTESCPINGAMYTKDERTIWEGRSPILTMIENHLDSRPPSGVSRADAVYEYVAEGGITRFLNVFYCGVSDKDYRIGPIRSARVHFIRQVAEYGKTPVFLHVGEANNICNNCPGGVKPAGNIAKQVDALSLMNSLGWVGANANSLDGGTNLGYPIVWRDYERIPGAATEHTFLGSTDKLFDEATKRGFGAKDSQGKPWSDGFVPWKFIDGKASSAPTASDISFEFWAGLPDYDVEWKYDSANNQYLRFNGGKPHTDMETKEQLSARNVVIQFVVEQGPVDKEKHMYYENIGNGKALVFQNGEVITGTWKKASLTDRTKFFDSTGKEISFVKGKIWIEGVPSTNQIKY